MKADEAVKMARDALIEIKRTPHHPDYDTYTYDHACDALAALDSLAVESKPLDPEIHAVVQENFWELAGKPKAVEPDEDVEGVVRDISTLCHTRAAVYFDWDVCSKIVTARDERIRREYDEKITKLNLIIDGCISVLHGPSRLRETAQLVEKERAAIMGGKE